MFRPNLLSPEQSTRELEGSLELEELGDRLEAEEHDEVDGFDLVYSKGSRASSGGKGSTYRLQDAKHWYDEEALGEINLEELEIDVQDQQLRRQHHVHPGSRKKYLRIQIRQTGRRSPGGGNRRRNETQPVVQPRSQEESRTHGPFLP